MLEVWDSSQALGGLNNTQYSAFLIVVKSCSYHFDLNDVISSGEEREEGQEDQKDGEAMRGEERGLWAFPSRRWPCEVGGARREGKRSCREREQGGMACLAGP